MSKRSAKDKIERYNKKIRKLEEKERQNRRRIVRVLESSDSDVSFDNDAANGNAELNQLKTADLPRPDDTRIVGGTPVTIDQYPFAVQVIYRAWFSCGGSLVTTRHVLSAAHCLVANNGDRRPPKTYTIRAATSFSNKGGSLHLVIEIKIHKLFNRKTLVNDVAVVLMALPVDLTTSVARPAFLPYQDAVVPDNSSVTVVGWGKTHEDNPTISLILNKVTVQKINLKTCQSRYKGLVELKTIITSSVICAGILDVGGKDACQGDSGGPMVYKGIVVGITSWGAGCGDPKYPGVYTNVANYTNWINYAVNDSQLQIQARNGTGNTGSLSSKVWAIALLTSLLYLILSVYLLRVN